MAGKGVGVKGKFALRTLAKTAMERGGEGTLERVMHRTERGCWMHIGIASSGYPIPEIPGIWP